MGITCQDPPNKRWLNGFGYKPNKHFWSAIQQYGWSNFEHTVLESGLSEEDALQLEKKYISIYKSDTREHGYNINSSSIGSGSMSEETKRKIGKANGGENHWTKKHNLSRKDNVHSKPVYCVELDRYFDSVIDAAESLNVHKSSVAECCRGERRFCKGLHFLYKCDVTDDAIANVMTKQRKTNAVPVLCYELNMVFPKAKDAVEYIKNTYGKQISFANLHAVCNGKRQHAGGYSWSYVR